MIKTLVAAAVALSCSTAYALEPCPTSVAGIDPSCIQTMAQHLAELTPLAESGTYPEKEWLEKNVCKTPCPAIFANYEPCPESTDLQAQVIHMSQKAMATNCTTDTAAAPTTAAAATTAAPTATNTTSTTAAPSGDFDCTTYPATCDVKDSAGTPCVTKFAEYADKEQGQPTCEKIEAAGVTKECLPLLVDSKLDFKDVEGKPWPLPESDQGIMVAVLSACATGAPIPDIPDDGPDEVLTPIDASVVLTGMTKDQFDAKKFAIATAKTMDISEEDITDVKVEEVAASSERRSLTATNLKVTFKVAVKDAKDAKDVNDRLTEAAKDGSFKADLEAAGITGFTGIDENSVTVATEQAPAEATPTPAAPPPTTTKAPTTTTTKAPTTTTTKAPVQTATTKAPVKTVTTAAAQTTTTLKSGAASVGLVATAVAVAAAAMA